MMRLHTCVSDEMQKKGDAHTIVCVCVANFAQHETARRRSFQHAKKMNHFCTHVQKKHKQDLHPDKNFRSFFNTMTTT